MYNPNNIFPPLNSKRWVCDPSRTPHRSSRRRVTSKKKFKTNPDWHLAVLRKIYQLFQLKYILEKLAKFQKLLLSHCVLDLLYHHQYFSWNKEIKMENTSEFYLRLFFDVNRGGFFDVAENILDYLDYKSFVQFKQSCKMVYEFIKTSNIEQVSLLILIYV